MDRPAAPPLNPCTWARSLFLSPTIPENFWCTANWCRHRGTGYIHVEFPHYKLCHTPQQFAWTHCPPLWLGVCLVLAAGEPLLLSSPLSLSHLCHFRHTFGFSRSRDLDTEAVAVVLLAGCWFEVLASWRQSSHLGSSLLVAAYSYLLLLNYSLLTQRRKLILLLLRVRTTPISGSQYSLASMSTI